MTRETGQGFEGDGEWKLSILLKIIVVGDIEISYAEVSVGRCWCKSKRVGSEHLGSGRQ